MWAERKRENEKRETEKRREIAIEMEKIGEEENAKECIV